MKEKTNCILCHYDADMESIHPLDKNFRYDCQNCGTYYVNQAFKEADKSHIPLHLLSGFALEQSKYGGMTKQAITLDSYPYILENHVMPKTREERLEQLMLYYYREIGDGLQNRVKINPYPAICYAHNAQEVSELFLEAMDKKYLTSGDDGDEEEVQVTLAGAEFCEATKERRLKTGLNIDKRSLEGSILSTIWPMIHPKVSDITKKLMLDGHYEYAITASVKLLENCIKDICKEKTGKDLSGTPLMQKVFNLQNPVLQFEAMDTQSGKNLQEGYRNIFAGVQLGIRNPYSHDADKKPSMNDALHMIIMISHLMHMVDKAVAYTNSIEGLEG
ncbi:MAG: TIGR02391 family protein [Peptostreptococcales bacterium]